MVDKEKTDKRTATEALAAGVEGRRMAKFAFGSDTNGSRAGDRVDSDGNAGGRGDSNVSGAKKPNQKLGMLFAFLFAIVAAVVLAIFIAVVVVLFM